MKVIIRVNETQQTKNWLKGRLQSRDLTTPTLKSLPYFSLALFCIIKRPVSRFSSSFFCLLCIFTLLLSDFGSFTVICEVWGPLKNCSTSDRDLLLHSSKRHVLSSEEVLATGPSTFVAHAKVCLIFLHK